MRIPGISSLTGALRATLLAGGAALMLAGCTGDDGPSPMSKASKSLSPQTVALINEKGMTRTSPIVVRIFKEESELEVWKQTTSGDYALLQTYPICRWSGELGPKVKEGDRQAPEGFYTVTPGQMNPNSQYHLSFDLGYPNAYDRSLNRTGANLMVHGDCTSRGCYAMTDEQVQEVFALGRESFIGGQRSFQVQAYPFRMTPDNMVRHRNNPHLAFWKMLKEGSDTFELTKAPPKVDVCNKRYVFNATPADSSQRFQASAACPPYSQPEGLEEALAARQKDVSTRIASAGALQPTAPVKTGKDGGMHKVFLAKLENPELNAPGSLPAIVKPPGSEWGVETNAPAPADSIALAKASTVVQGADGPMVGSAGASVGTSSAPAGAPAAAPVQVAGGVPLPAPRPTDAPGGSTTQVAATPQAPSLFGAFAPATSPVRSTPAGTQVASLDGGAGFFDGLKNLFGGSAQTAPSAAPAAAPATAAAGTPADVPLPPERPEAAQSASARPATAPARATPQAPAAPRPAAAATPAATSPVSAAAVVTRPTHPGYGSATSTVATSAAAPALRPSVANSTQQSLYGTQALPGASILAPGGFSSSVQ